ncbi:MAG: hypothetical protein LUO93_10525 [Methanomicrobiales archaeon]|nr:hypothetical protein [Methanomicrobiales archaeon]
MIKKVILGSVHYAAGRAFIPVIEEAAETQEMGGLFFARLISMVVLEGESAWVYPFDRNLSMEELVSIAPQLPHTIEETRKILGDRSLDAIRNGEPRSG